MSLAQDRNTPELGAGGRSEAPVKAGAKLYAGALVVLDAGFAKASVAAAALIAAGIARKQIDNTAGADGDEVVPLAQGVFRFGNSAGADEITQADLNQPAWVVDDETVAKTSAGGARSFAGRIVAVDEQGVWVEVGKGLSATPRKVYLPFAISETDTLAGTSAELVSPGAGTITGMQVIVTKAVTTGGAVTAAVGVTAVDGLSCAVADGAAKGTVVSDTPTAGHASRTVAQGDRIQVIPAAAFNTAGAVSGLVEITLS